MIIITNGSVPKNFPSNHQLKNLNRLTIPYKKLIIIFCMEDQITAFNLKYRQINRPTNILSFPSNHNPKVKSSYLGDLFMCASYIEQTYQRFSNRLQDHYCHLIIHGILHLKGYSHDDDHHNQLMMMAEKKILAGLNIPYPYHDGDKL